MLPMLPGFVVAVALLAMVPGPATALVIRQTVRDGRRTALVTTAGNEVGLLAWAIASAWYVLIAWLVSRARAFMRSTAVRRRLERLTGLVVLGLGARLAIEHR